MESADGNAELEEWESLADDVARTLEKICDRCLHLPLGTEIWSAEGVAARIALRANELLAATLALVGLDAIAASRTVTRSLLECAFSAAALTTDPNQLIAMLRDDTQASRRRQGKFAIAQRLGGGESRLKELRQTIDEIEATETISPKKVAELGQLVKFYFYYQRLSDDSAHLTARSLDHYVARDEQGGWTTKEAIPSAHDSAATLRIALQGSLLTGVAICEVLHFSTQEIGVLYERFMAMPATKFI